MPGMLHSLSPLSTPPLSPPSSPPPSESEQQRHPLGISHAVHLSLWHPDAWQYRIEGGQKMVFASCPATLSHPPCLLDIGADHLFEMDTSVPVSFNAGRSSARHPHWFAELAGQSRVPRVLCLYNCHGPPPCVIPQRAVVRYLTPYLMPVVVVDIERVAASRLVRSAAVRRPAYRLRAGGGEGYFPHTSVTVQLDAARFFGPSTVLVEMKAKCALRSTSKLIPPFVAHTLHKYDVLPYYVKNYLMHSTTATGRHHATQRHKHHPHRGSCRCRHDDSGDSACGVNVMDKFPVSESYNPTDLLTICKNGDGCRQRRAAAALMREKSRILRIFVDGGRQVQQSEIDEQQTYGNGGERERIGEQYERVVQLATDALAIDKEACRGIMKIQALDRVDAMGAAVVMQQLIHRVGKNEAERRVTRAVRGLEYSAFPNEDDTESLFNDTGWQSALAYDCAEQATREHCEQNYRDALSALDSLPTCVLLQILADYLQSAAAKDCSLLVALCRVVDTDVALCDEIRRQTAFGDDNEREVDEDCYGQSICYKTDRRSRRKARGKGCGLVSLDGEEWVYRIWVVDIGEKDVRKILNKWPQQDLNRVSKLLSVSSPVRLSA